MEIPHRFPDHTCLDVYGLWSLLYTDCIKTEIVHPQASLLWMPESPRYLAKVGRVEEAKDLLRRLRATDDSDIATDEKIHHVADSELNDIMQVIELEQKHSKMNSYWNMFWGVGSGDLHIARRVQLSIWLQIFQECVLNGHFRYLSITMAL